MSTPVRLFALGLLGLVLAAQATQRGITEKGDEVLLEDDGTWRYVKAPPEAAASAVPLNATRFTRAKDAAFPVRSARNNAVVYINPKKWTFSKSAKNGDGEFTFKSADGDMIGVLIAERISVPLETLGPMALNNMRKAAPDAEVVSQEYRYVNDRKMLYMRMNATVQGVKFVYDGYYYSDDSGTTQLLAMTTPNLARSHLPQAEEFLDGLVPGSAVAPAGN